MTLKKADWKNLRQSKRKTLKYGKRSIYDIIKDPLLSFADKVDYIRHHYVYYDGNYEYFHDDRGKSNEKKEELNKLISNIIQRLAEPSELKIINKRILAWRKERKQIEKQIQLKALNEYGEKAKRKAYERRVFDWIISKQGYDANILSMIKQYLLNNEDLYTYENFAYYPYKELKKRTKLWLMRKEDESNITNL